MNVTVENQPRSQTLVTVEVEPERMAVAKEQAYQRIAREVVIPGFRKGKAPRNLVQRYVNPDLVQDDAETHLMDEIWRELREGQFKDTLLYDSPRVNVMQHNPFTFQLTLTLQPSVQLGDYKSIRIAPELVTVSDDDVNRTIERLREQQAQWQPVEHRPVRQGDMITVQAHGNVGKQPIILPQGYSIVVEPTSGFLVPGFAMRLIDIEIGKEREFDVQAPDNTSDPEMAGATGKAYVTVTEIKEKILPALDDAFAKTMGYDDVATLMDKTRSSLLKEREEAARNRLIDQILDAIAGVSTVSFPDILVDRQTEKMINDRAAVLKQQGIDMPLYLRLLGMTMDEMRAQVRNQAEKRIRNYLLVEELSRAEGIVVEDAAVAAEIERLAADMQDPEAARRALSTNEMHDQVKDRLALDRLFDRLIAIVTEGQEPVAPSSESALPSVTDTVMADEEQKENEPEQPKLIIATH